MFSRVTRRLANRRLSLLAYDSTSITVNIEGKDVSFDNVFLRDSCTSPDSVDISTSQKSFTTASISRGLNISEKPYVGDQDGEKTLFVKWQQGSDAHDSAYTESFLKKALTLKSRFEGKFFPEEKVYWRNKDLVPKLGDLKVDYNAYFAKDEVFKKVVNNLNKYGLSFIENVEDPLKDPKLDAIKPENEHLWPVSKLAHRFGYIKKTFYGVLFDVKNEKNAKNIANTNVFLPLHMDLLYYESPPGLQLLHFIQNTTLGGENIFADSFAAGYHIRDTDPAAYEALKKVPITYHYNNNNEYYYYLRPLIVEDPYVKNFTNGEPQIKEVNYAPPFQGPFEFHVTSSEDAELWQDFLRGMRLFEDFINDPNNTYEVKLPEGSCVIFDNRRVLHSRNQFSDSNGGDRWLMGTYVDGDSYRSKLRKLNQS
ncbi:hypothetical protein C7M61_001324 [Candidozyma pseudohaemuli]|uniref:TauD/TfdA-like domain-containing protein n=1 Tax=Candidozyma pseudohaemuli TaxID=418784 RepID=A0A2P7Z0A1_9ASCO|nr:hypothetical protein C7M61_001324 [[Candida] pseudohaemulonii]PSK41637.1 hypothetical protein C7M61_001324 [[Candida] pseudohaemulonii]